MTVVFSHHSLDMFGIEAIIDKAKSQCSHIIIVDPHGNWSEPIDVYSENHEVVYKIDEFKMAIRPVEDDVLLLKDDKPHYRDLEFRKKERY